MSLAVADKSIPDAIIYSSQELVFSDILFVSCHDNLG